MLYVSSSCAFPCAWASRIDKSIGYTNHRGSSRKSGALGGVEYSKKVSKSVFSKPAAPKYFQSHTLRTNRPAYPFRCQVPFSTLLLYAPHDACMCALSDKPGFVRATTLRTGLTTEKSSMTSCSVNVREVAMLSEMFSYSYVPRAQACGLVLRTEVFKYCLLTGMQQSYKTLA